MTSDFEMNRGAMGGGGEKPPLPNSKSVPALHSNLQHMQAAAAAANKSRSINNLITTTGPTSAAAAASQHQHHHPNSSLMMNTSNSSNNFNSTTVPDQGFYQNLSVYRAQNQSQPNLER